MPRVAWNGLDDLDDYWLGGARIPVTRAGPQYKKWVTVQMLYVGYKLGPNYEKKNIKQSGWFWEYEGGLTDVDDDIIIIKGTVSRDFLLSVFFINQFPPSPRVSH